MSRSLQEVVDALARAGVLIDAPNSQATPLPLITGLTADARRLERGMLFCAVRGAVLDGHTFVANAAAGARRPRSWSHASPFLSAGHRAQRPACRRERLNLEPGGRRHGCR
jgi:UDP-N-acetylmuramyl tripeptide synthase